MTNLAIVLGILFFLICLGFVILHSLRLGALDPVRLGCAWHGWVYGICWSLVASVTRAGGNPTWEQWLLPYVQLYPVYTASTLVLIGSMWLGWLMFGSLHIKQCRVAPSLFSRKDDSRLIMAMWVLLVSGVILQWLYTQGIWWLHRLVAVFRINTLIYFHRR